MPKLSVEPSVHETASLENSQLGAYTEISERCSLINVTMGDYSYCSRFCDFANAEIGKFVNIAAMVRIGATDHPMERACQHHFMYRSRMYWDDVEDDAAFFEKRRARVARIGHDTWLGHGAMVMPEVTVGHGAVIAAKAVVTKDVGPYEVWAGLPARKIKLRHPPEIGERLMALAWWDWSHQTLRDRLEDFRSLPVAAFLEKYEG